jgi:hypothetical protein
MHDDLNTGLPADYHSDLLSDPCVIILRRPAETIRGLLHPLRRSRGDKAGRRRRPQKKSGGGTGRLKERFLVALFFYGLLACSQERRGDACIQHAPV